MYIKNNIFYRGYYCIEKQGKSITGKKNSIANEINSIMTQKKQQHRSFSTSFFIFFGIFILVTLGLYDHAVAQVHSSVAPSHLRKSCSIDRDGAVVDFTVTGRMPEQARMSVTSVEREDEEGNPMLAAYDITLTDGRGQEWQPAYGQPAQVTITDPNFGHGKKLDIYHETDEGREYVTTVISANNTVTFPAKHFSVYVIGTPNGRNRMVVSLVFPRGYDTAQSPDVLLYDTLSVLVKCRDTIYNNLYIPRLIYPPNITYIPPKTDFFGWSLNKNHTAAATDRMTIDGVRSLVIEHLKQPNVLTEDLGDTMIFYAVLLKTYNIYYRSQSKSNVVIGVEDVLYLRDDPPLQEYVINESYIPDEANANFLGWRLVKGESNILEADRSEDGIYPNGTVIHLTGDITFMEDLAYGYWLAFNENGSGASYTAPKFLISNDIEGFVGDSLSSAKPDDPTRYGYKFGGWYADPACTQEFSFEGYLNQDTVIHAKWITNDSADYAIMIWRQNLDRDGYDFAGAYAGRGAVGQSIVNSAITTGVTGHLTYAVLFPGTSKEVKLGGIKSVRVNTETDPYTGFTLSTVNPIIDTVVLPSGKSVVNIYFDRMKYTIKLYVTRTNADGTGNFLGTKKGNSLHPESPYFLGHWDNNNIVKLNSITTIFDSVPSQYDVDADSNRYYYYPITAYYGALIDTLWPTYDTVVPHFTNPGNNRFVSWVLMSTAKAFNTDPTNIHDSTGNGTGGNTIKGHVQIMDEHILGRLDDTTGNLLMARYGSSNDWTYEIYLADADGNYPSVPSNTIYARSGGAATAQKLKAPSVDGYRNILEDNTATETPERVAKFYYQPRDYQLVFEDGVYWDGNGNQLPNSSKYRFRIEYVSYKGDISSFNHYEPGLAPGEVGFEFDGWYIDETCKQPYTFDKMPMSNLIVYARWRQIQYRVFLHPQADRDPSLDWGETDNTTQEMNFRKSYGDKISTPTGLRDLYEFEGWYFDPECHRRFFPDVTTLNESTVTTKYIKGESMTDSMDRWGYIHDPVGRSAYNSDTIVIIGNDTIGKNNRFWIKKRLDLYARWRHKLDNADGVNVQYFCDSCIESTMPPRDTNLYLDKSKMVAEPAPKAKGSHKIFSSWVLQRWDNLTKSFVDSLNSDGSPVIVYPGGPFVLHLPDARHEYDPETDKSTYTYQLRAALETFDDNHTFIVWYRNWTGHPDGDTVQYDIPDTLTINMTAIIPSAEKVGTRTGYIYQGWRKESRYPEESGQETTHPGNLINPDSTVNFLWYDSVSHNYYSIKPPYSDEYLAYGVGADEITPYDFFYAVWEPIRYKIRFHKNNEEATGEMADQEFVYDKMQFLSKNAFLYECHRFLGWTLHPDDTALVRFSNEQEILNLTSKNDSLIHLYAKWDDENPQLVVTPKNATCLTLGSLNIDLQGISMPNYTYRVMEIDTLTNTLADTVWYITSSDTLITAEHLPRGKYRVEVITGSGCKRSIDTVITLNPTEIQTDQSLQTVCSGSPFVIKPSSNDDVKYLWNAPEYSGVTLTPDTANLTDPKDCITGTIINTDGEVNVSYDIHFILGYCQLGDVVLNIDVSTASYPEFTITLDPSADTLCGGDTLNIVANVNSGITSYSGENHQGTYTLGWVFHGDTIFCSQAATNDTILRRLTMPDTCRGDFSLEVYYADVTACRANALKTFKVRVKEWNVPENDTVTVHCVQDAVLPDATPGLVPTIPDGCGNLLEPKFYNKLLEPGDLSCSGTVTYTYMYMDCEGNDKYWNYVYLVKKEAPVIRIDSVLPPKPINDCWYEIPEVLYTVFDCNPDVLVTQNPAPTERVQQVANDTAIVITLTAVDKCGDSTMVNTSVTIPGRPTVEPSVVTPEFCVGSSTVIKATMTGISDTAKLHWSVDNPNGTFTYDADTLFSASEPGLYVLTAKVVENGCVARKDTVVKVDATAELSITNKNQTLCLGATLAPIHINNYYSTIDTSGYLPLGVTFYESDHVIAGNPNNDGEYTCVITARSFPNDQCGVIKDTVTIKVVDMSTEPMSITGDSTFCEGSFSYIYAQSGQSYRWTKESDSIISKTRGLAVTEPGTYTVMMKDDNGCIHKGTKTMTMNPKPVVAIDLNTPVCPDTYSQQLNATITSSDRAPYSYFWSIDNGASVSPWNAPTPTVSLKKFCDTTYHVSLTLTDSNGCQTIVSNNIVMQAQPPTIERLAGRVEAISVGDCAFQMPNLLNYIQYTDSCSLGKTNIYWTCPSEDPETGAISQTDTVTITVIDSCGNSASTKIEVFVPITPLAAIEKDSVVINSFEWGGVTYKESMTVEGDYTDEEGCGSIRVHFIVLKADIPDTAICQGESAELVVSVEPPVMKVRPAVGDVLCLKQTATDTYDTLVLRPDTFLARAAAESLTPIGVVFFVDPTDDRKGKALALVDANPNVCKWANDNTSSVNDGNSENGNNFLNAALDLNGIANTEQIKTTASANSAEFSTKAPAAYRCYNYNPLTQTTGTDSKGWYLPSAGEVSLWYAHRLAINRTMALLKSSWTTKPANFNINIPFENTLDNNNKKYTGYWTSTDSSTKAEYINQEGEISLKNKSDSRNARAVCSFVLNPSEDPEPASMPHHIGDIITFPDNSRGVICYVDPENPHKGWAAALQDLDNDGDTSTAGTFKLLPYSPSESGIPFLLKWSSATNNTNYNAPNDYTGFGRTAWEDQSGYASGMENTRKLLRLSNSPLNDRIDTNNWYIPDMMQLRQWYALFPIIKDVQGIKLPNTNWETNQYYWSSTGTRKADEFGSMKFPNGYFETKSGANNTYHIRLVRDFNTADAIAYWNDHPENPTEDPTENPTEDPTQSAIEVRPAVGDVLCLKQTAPDTYDTLVLRPDTFLTRADEDSLIPIGVVFYVDPTDDRKGKALALVDANPNACKWANDNSSTINDGRGGNGYNLLNACKDLSGLTNTENILLSANSDSTTAPAAYNCYHYNPLTQKTHNGHCGWYLPAIGELNLWFVQRVTVNQTLVKLKNNWPNTQLDITVPLSGITTDCGYWSSTDLGDEKAIMLNPKGQMKEHFKDGSASSSTFSVVPKYVRAVYSY